MPDPCSFILKCTIYVVISIYIVICHSFYPLYLSRKNYQVYKIHTPQKGCEKDKAKTRRLATRAAPREGMVQSLFVLAQNSKCKATLLALGKHPAVVVFHSAKAAIAQTAGVSADMWTTVWAS